MASSEDQANLLTQFQEVTGVDQERAKFYLEAANWEMQAAMGSFFETHESEDIEAPVAPARPANPQATVVGQTQPPPKPPTSRPSQPQRGGLVTFDTLRADSDSSDDDDNKQAFYTGGSETSGQQVLGPPKNRDELIADMFKKAREMGAEEMSPQMFKKKGDSRTPFGGTGYTLGDNTGQSSSGAGAAANAEPEVQDVVLHLWSNGFSVDDGPLRSYQDPANLAFLDAVKRGEVPVELRQKFGGKDCTLSIMDKRGQEFAGSKSNVQAFAGRGQTLGSPTPSVTVGATAGPKSEDDKKANEAAARNSVQLIAGQPTTSIQFRLTDGSRLVGQFNHGHTVQDLYTYVNTARPEYSSVNYELTLFPNTRLTEKATSLKDANILNSALVQKITQ